MESKLVTIEQILQNPKYPFSKSQLRNLLLHRDKNGLSLAVRKIGKYVYIREDLFDAWIDSFEEKGSMPGKPTNSIQ